jgi:benzoyl-CoA reductase subunit C
MSNDSTFSKVQAHYDNYGSRAGELAEAGEKIIGYICSFVPLELITAAGCVPIRMRGDVREPISTGDNFLENIVCPYYRSCFDLAVKGRYDFLSGMVIPHACDSMTRSFSTLSYSLNYPYFHFVNIPSVVKEHSFTFFRAELETFQRSLESFLGKEITGKALDDAITLHNDNRKKVRAIYDFRKSDPPLISGTELTTLLTVGSSLPVGEANDLFDEALAELGRRKDSPVSKGPRIMIDGACVDNVELVRIIEGLGANVVTDTLCNGTRDHFPLVARGDDPLDVISRRYLAGIHCPKTYRENKTGTFDGDIAARFNDIGRHAGSFAVDGAILYVYRYCDPFGFEVPARRAFYESIDVPLLCVEDEYSSGTIGQLKTRIQAFLEMIE